MSSLARIFLLATLSSLALAVAPPQIPRTEILAHVKGLHSDDYQERISARRELIKLARGRNVPFLYQVLGPLTKGTDPEVRRQSRAILEVAIPRMTNAELVSHTADLIRKGEPIVESRDVLDHVFRSLSKDELRDLSRLDGDRSLLQVKFRRLTELLKEHPGDIHYQAALKALFLSREELNGKMGAVYGVAIRRLGAVPTRHAGAWYFEHNNKNYLIYASGDIVVVPSTDKPINVTREFEIDLTRGWPSDLVRFPDGQLVADAVGLKITSSFEAMSGTPFQSGYQCLFVDDRRQLRDLNDWIARSLQRLYGDDFSTSTPLLVPSLRRR